MANIYQEIWNADQDANGIPAILDSENGDPEKGFVKVSGQTAFTTDPEHKVITNVVIPPEKMRTYDLCKKLFNNYALPESDPENDSPGERTERHDFVNAIIDTPPMRIARQYIGQKIGTTLSDERWHNVLMDHWFRVGVLSSGVKGFVPL